MPRIDRVITAWVLSRIALLHADDEERGDVPGWVMVAVMTAALVVFLLSVAKTPLQTAFQNAISKVTGAS
jgi:hypothetical protein